MVIAALCDNELKAEFIEKGIPVGIVIMWADTVKVLYSMEADVYFDLLFEMDNERIERVKKILPKPVFVNAVTYSLKQIGEPFIRINAWPTMLRRNITEIAVADDLQIKTAESIFQQLNWKYQVVPDVPGMITSRILAMIINEAYYTLGAEVSTKEEIDTAMKLGTNYPLGPFEWSEKIGLNKIYELLTMLSKTDNRYAVAPALGEEIKLQGL